jgi:hypothetical protein
LFFLNFLVFPGQVVSVIYENRLRSECDIKVKKILTLIGIPKPGKLELNKNFRTNILIAKGPFNAPTDLNPFVGLKAISDFLSQNYTKNIIILG